MNRYKVISCEKSSASFYNIQVSPGDVVWAIFEETRGVVAITGSFCDVVHAWPKPGRGSGTIQEFFLSAGADYLVDKFSYGQERAFREQFSPEKTVEAIKKFLQEEGIAEDILTEWLEVFDDVETDNPDQFFNSIQYENEDLYNYLSENGDGLHSWIQVDPSNKYITLQNVVIPLIKEALKKEIGCLTT